MRQHDSALPGLGDWVKAVNFGPSEIVDDNETVPPGTTGQVIFIDGDGVTGTRHVKWENGMRLGVIPGHDDVEIVLPAKPCKVCDVRCTATDANDPESYVHENGFNDHAVVI